jgi:hypothetical protein
MKIELAVDGTGNTPRMRPGEESERARGDLSFNLQKGHVEALRSTRARQLGHIRWDVS